MLTPQRVDKESPLLGEPCALCRDPLAPGDEAVLCPEDGTRHHARCWTANGSHCASYGCMGSGEVQTASTAGVRNATAAAAAAAEPVTPAAQGRIARVISTLSAGCLLLSIALAIILIAFSCFGLWAIADYILLEILGWQYRQPLSGAAGWSAAYTVAYLIH